MRSFKQGFLWLFAGIFPVYIFFNSYLCADGLLNIPQLSLRIAHLFLGLVGQFHLPIANDSDNYGAAFFI